MLLGINGLITEVRKEYVSGNQQFPTGQVYFGFVVQFFFFSAFPIRQQTPLKAE